MLHASGRAAAEPGSTALLRICRDEGLTIALMGSGTLVPVVDLADAIAETPLS